MTKGSFKDIKGAIERYNHGMSPMTWMSIFAMSLEQRLFSINFGRSGDSKSWSTTNLALRLGICRPEDVSSEGHGVSPAVIAPNNCTDRTFFNFIKCHANKCIIIDDATKLTKQQISFLKEATGEAGEVEYTTARDSERNRFIFTGSILMNTNYEKQEMAISTRAYINYYYFDHEELIKRRNLAREYTTDMTWEKDNKIWMLIKKRIEEMILDNINGKEITLTQAESAKVFKIVDKIDVDFYSESSMRDDSRAIRIAKMFKHFFGELNNDVFNLAGAMIKHYLTSGIKNKSDCVAKIVKQYLKKYGTESIRLYELIEILKSRYPNHNFKAWLDTAFATKAIERGRNRQYVVLPNSKPKIIIK
jgi:hypothetical protein